MQLRLQAQKCPPAPVPSSHLFPLADRDEVFPQLQEGGALEEQIIALFR